MKIALASVGMDTALLARHLVQRHYIASRVESRGLYPPGDPPLEMETWNAGRLLPVCQTKTDAPKEEGRSCSSCVWPDANG